MNAVAAAVVSTIVAVCRKFSIAGNVATLFGHDTNLQSFTWTKRQGLLRAASRSLANPTKRDRTVVLSELDSAISCLSQARATLTETEEGNCAFGRLKGSGGTPDGNLLVMGEYVDGTITTIQS